MTPRGPLTAQPAWIEELPPLDAFGMLVLLVVGQQLFVRATRTIMARLHRRVLGVIAHLHAAERRGCHPVKDRCWRVAGSSADHGVPRRGPT